MKFTLFSILKKDGYDQNGCVADWIYSYINELIKRIWSIKHMENVILRDEKREKEVLCQECTGITVFCSHITIKLYSWLLYSEQS